MPVTGEKDRLAMLAEEVRNRRTELHLTQQEVRERGGPSPPTQTRIENAVPPEPAMLTLKNIDKALRWKEGSASRVLTRGEPPQPLESVSGANGTITDVLPALLTTDLGGGPLRRLLEIRRQLDLVIEELRAV